MSSIYGETLAPYHLHESSIVIAEQDQDERPSPQSFEPTRETSTRRRRRCTSEGVRSAFVSCGCDPSSTGSPARRSDRGVPFWGGLAQQNTVQSSEHLIKFHPFKWSTMRMRTAHWQNIAAYFRVLVHNPGLSRNLNDEVEPDAT